MSDGMNREQQAQKALFFSVKQETLKMKDRLEQGNVPFLPNRDGYADTNGIRSAITGKLFHGTNQLLAKCYLTERGDQSNKLLTFAQANNNGTTIKRGEHGFTLSVYDAEKKEAKTYRYFSINQVADKDKIPKVELPVKNQSSDTFSVTKMTCFDTDPVKYLGKYLMTVSLDCQFSVPPDIAQTFKKKFLLELEDGIKQEKYTKLFEIGNAASVFCRSELSTIFAKEREMQKLVQQAHPKLERTSPSMGR